MVLFATVALASCKSSFNKKRIIQQIDSLNNSETQALYLVRLKEKDQWLEDTRTSLKTNVATIVTSTKELLN
jgi:hypothetical protein